MKTISKFIKNLKLFFYRLFDKNSNNDQNILKVFWFDKRQNFGDTLNPTLLHTLTGKTIRLVNYYSTETHYIAIGSILDKATKDTIVWGSGFISDKEHCLEKPKQICAVRGPKSRAKLLEDGIECPEVYGDPALLLPMIYSPKISKTHKLGIIPHFLDKNNEWLKNKIFDENIKIIDIQNPNLFLFINEILSCEKIASSSLHGIITADAYHIPSLWIEFSDKVQGNGFKFLDYFLSVNRNDKAPLIIKQDTSVKDIYESFNDYTIKIDLNKLLDACPFEIKKI